MASTDFHLRRLIYEAQRAGERTQASQLVNDAFALIEGNASRFTGEDFSPELLVIFAEAASDLGGHDPQAERALELYDRLGCEDDQFTVRSLLVRCLCEARLGEQHRLKGHHLLQQLQYALRQYLMKALAKANETGWAQNDSRYGFLIYNTSLIFWSVARPMCRNGWQRHIINEATAVLDALRAVRAASGAGAAGGKPGGKGAAGGATIPVSIDIPWLVELTLNLAFGLEDAGRDAEAQKKADEAQQLLDELLKEPAAADPAMAGRNTRLQQLVWNARAYFNRKAPGKVKDDIVKGSGSTVLGAALFVFNGATTPDAAAEELIKAWGTIDADYDLRAARDSFSTDPRAPRPDGGQVARGIVKPQMLVDLALALRAACVAKQWPLAFCMIRRLEKFQMPPGRGCILLDLSRAECEVWYVCTVKKEDPTSKMLLSAAEQEKREVETRHRSVKLLEQCIMIAKRIEADDLVEECAVVMWNISRELMSDQNRYRVHEPLAKCLELLEEMQSNRLIPLRVQLHFEIAHCEVASDLLTKGCGEFERANTLDYTVTEAELPDTVRPVLALSDGPLGRDPAHYIRRFDEATEEHLNLLHWKTNLYEEPSQVADQVMLVLDQVSKVKGVKNDKGEVMPLSEEKKRLNYNLLVQVFEKLEQEMEQVIGNDRLQSLSDTFDPPPKHIMDHEPLKPLPFQAKATVAVGGGPAQVDGKPVLDKRPKSEKEDAIQTAKRIIALMCQCGLEAKRAEEGPFAVQVCSKALSYADVAELKVGPWPTEVESALLLTQAAYTKAQCLSWEIKDQGVLNGIDEEINEEQEEEESTDETIPPDVEEAEEQEEIRELTAEEKAALSEKKREMIRTLLYGLELSHQFGQHWMVSNGLVHFWNLHLDTVATSHDNPKLLKRALQEYRDALKELQKYLTGPAALPDSEFSPKLAANLTLASINASVAVGSLEALDTANLLTLKRLGPCERKEIMARVVQVCKENEKPLPDAAQLKTQAQGAPPAKGQKGAPEVSDPSDLQGNEVDIMVAVMSMPKAKDADEACKLVDQAVALLNKWKPPANDEAMLTLWVELWTRLGRQCLKPPMNPSIGAKYALMCSMQGLGAVDAPIPKYASNELLRWRGACHALCGEVFASLINPLEQEKESLAKLRRLSVEQFERCCEYAITTCNHALASFGASALWNVALSFMDSAETRALLVEPLSKATRALAAVKFNKDPFFFAGLYAALYDCYADQEQWDQVNEMLKDAFLCVPTASHPRLRALRVLALSHQGKNVTAAMDKIKAAESMGGSTSGPGAGLHCDDGPSGLSSKEVLAQCRIATRQLHSELERLRKLQVTSKEWVNDLHLAMDKHLKLGQDLKAAHLYQRHLSDCMDFLEEVYKLLEGRETELNRNPQNAAALTYAGLEEFASLMEQAILATQPSRDAVLSMTLPVEGIEQDVAIPSEILVVKLDIWHARVLSLRRCIQANAKLHGKLQKERMKRASDPKNAPLFAVCSNEGGFFGKSFSDSANFGADDDPVQKWLQLVQEQISEEEKITHYARDMAEVEVSVAKVSNAVSVLEFAVQPPEDEEAEVVPGYSALWAEAKSELGRLQLELSTRQATLVRSAGKSLEDDAPVAAANVIWDQGEADPTEKRGLEAAERYSNKLNAQDPSQVFQAVEEVTGESDEAVQAVDEEGLLDFKEFARFSLCEAAKTALTTMNIPAAQRAFEVLACQSYGLRYPMATFEFLCWLQSTEVCMREEQVFKEKLPEDNDERVQFHLLRRLERRWPFPGELSIYKALKQSLETESRFFQRRQLDKLPAIEDILLSHLPALTLVVSLQFRGNFIYLGAVCTPPETITDRTERVSRLTPLVARHPVAPAEVHAAIRGILVSRSLIEKHLLTQPEPDPQLQASLDQTIQEVEVHLMEPLSRRLEASFWPCGVNAELPATPNPKQLVLLPDTAMAAIPFETMPSFTRLFGSGSDCIMRDHSLHMLAKRVRESTDVVEAPLKVPLQTATAKSSTLLDKV